MSTTSKNIYSVRALERLSKDTGNDIELIGSIFLPPKSYRGFDASLNYFLLRPICSKVERNTIFD
jgi:hypothetical protein